MLSVAKFHAIMTDTLVEHQAPPEEVLEDGEIDDEDEEEEVVTEETVIAEENSTLLPGQANADASNQSDSVTNERHDNEEENDSPEDERKKSHKKHQRKRKKHRDSKEKELRALEKKERRRKRKMHTNEDGTEAVHEHGGSVSPHSRKRKKRKKHSRDRKDRDSTTPESNVSDEQYSSAYYGPGSDYGNDYANAADMYSTKVPGGYNVNNSSSAYYSATADQGDYNDQDNYASESGSDFEAQLAEYQNYKTHGATESETYSGESNIRKDKRWGRDSRKTKTSSIERETSRKSKTGEMYEEFMEYDENPRRPCKFFAEGKCLKGNECSFSHDQTLRQRMRMKKKEMCKYYLAGHCHHGSQCSYMHGEYPCKYFHTGATCYAGDNCRFSHDPSTEETKEIIENFKDVLSNVDDSWEIAELAKAGIEVRPKPPPGMGLLPTPDMLPLTATKEQKTASSGGSSIPSIFDISVAPTADFQKRIEENTVASLSMTDESEGTSETGTIQSSHGTYQSQYERPTEKVQRPNLKKGGGLLPTPSIPPNPNLVAQSELQSHIDDSFYDNFYEGEHHIESNEKLNFEDRMKVEKSDEDIIKTDDEFLRIDNSTTDEEHMEEHALKAPDFLPATQKALFMRIHGKRTSSESDRNSNKENSKVKDPDSWTYSSDEDEKSLARDPGIIKMDVDVPVASSESPQTSSAAVESILKMITSKGGNSTAVDTNLLSKVASVINMPTTTSASTEHYNPASSVATYNPAQSKASPHHSSSTSTHHTNQRERKTSGSTSTSPGHSSKHHRPHPIRRRLSTQELTKEPVAIPLVTKQSGNQTMHSAHPDPRLTLSRLIGVKASHFSANLPRFSKDLILPGSGKMVGLKITLSSEDSKTSKRDPRLGRHKDPRLHRSNDPRLKSRTVAKAAMGATATEKSSVPTKPSALLTKSSTAIPSLPELDLNLAHINQHSSKENGDDAKSTPNSTNGGHSLPNLKLPKLVKAPVASPSHDPAPSSSPGRDASGPPPTIAPYDPRYMSSGSAKSSGPDLSMNTAPYDPRVLTSHSSLPAGMELKKRTIQLPKLTPAPSYKPSETSSEAVEDRPEGDQGDF